MQDVQVKNHWDPHCFLSSLWNHCYKARITDMDIIFFNRTRFKHRGLNLDLDQACHFILCFCTTCSWFNPGNVENKGLLLRLDWSGLSLWICYDMLDWFPSFIKLYFRYTYIMMGIMYLISSRESYSCDCACSRKTFQHKLQYFFCCYDLRI